jgi:hypothetical protein
MDCMEKWQHLLKEMCSKNFNGMIRCAFSWRIYLSNSKSNQNKLYHLKNWKNPIFANRAFFFEHTVHQGIEPTLAPCYEGVLSRPSMHI